jgi:hypothetical protein
MPLLLLALFALQSSAPKKPGFVVIAPATWTKALEPFVRARSAELTVESATIEDLFAHSDGVDAPEKIKRYLYRCWKERGVRYALLVGDADTFPVRFMVLESANGKVHAGFAGLPGHEEDVVGDEHGSAVELQEGRVAVRVDLAHASGSP